MLSFLPYPYWPESPKRHGSFAHVIREADPHDRRRQIIRLRQDAIAPIMAVYAPIQEAMFELWSSYSARDLRMIEDFITRSLQIHADCIERIRADPSRQRRTPGKKLRGR